MLRLFSKFFSCASVIALLVTPPLQAMDSEDQLPFPSAKRNLPPEMLFPIYDRLKERDLNNLSLTCKTHHETVSEYLVYYLMRQINKINIGVADKTPYALSRCTKEVELRNSFLGELESKMKAESFLFIQNGSFIASFLQTQFPSILDETVFLNNPGAATELYQALFNSPLPTDENKCIALTHLLASWPLQNVFFSEGNEEKGSQAFFKQYTEILTKKLKNLCNQQPYFSLFNQFQDTTILEKTTQNIVITDKQLADPNIKAKLGNILHTNPLHTLILSVGESDFVENNVLRLSNENFPPFLQKLRIIDTKSIVTTIGNGFLERCEGLTSVDLSFPNLATIGNNFLERCEGLTSVDLSFPNLATIGNNFLFLCEGLTSVDLSFPNLTTIGNGFLYRCEGLTSVNLSFPMLTTIGNTFLYRCEGLTSVDLSFPNLTTIGSNFLFLCKGLTSVNLAFPKLTTIGNGFLERCEGLTSVDLAFPNLTTIGNNFLFLCKGLTSVDLSFPNLTTIGSNFLFLCEGLTSVDLAFPKLTTIGNGFLERGEGLTSVDLAFPKLTTIGNDFLRLSGGVEVMLLPKTVQLFYKALGVRIIKTEEKDDHIFITL